MTTLRPGEARSPGISYQDLLDTDTHPVPEVLRIDAPQFLGDDDIPKERFTSYEWHRKEVEFLWKRVWQFACREDDIPRSGDVHIYEVAELSFIIVRQSDMSIKAYPNACLHRGRRLRDYNGHCSELRCAFHGFAWKLDGALQDIPARWDFPHVDDAEFHLPEIKVDTWAGFVMINPDTNAGSLQDFLGEAVEQFEVWDLDGRYTEAHVAKIVPGNWKICQEAFCEAYHVSGTHPQILPYLGCTNSQVDVWENFARVITPGGTPSPQLGDDIPSQEDMMRAMLDIRVDQDLPVRIPEGHTMRATAAEMSRNRWRATAGDRVETMSDAELMDSIDYTIFPNFHPWGAYNRIVYRFRPNGDDQRSAIMEVLFLSPYTGEKPPNAPVHWLEPHQNWSDATELGMLGKVFDQDMFNIPNVQRGLEATYKPGVTLGNYQEAKVRWLHKKLGEWVDGGPK